MKGLILRSFLFFNTLCFFVVFIDIQLPMNQQIIEMIIDEEEDFNGIDAVSVVENPAIELDFIALKKQQELKLAEVDKDEQILMGPALVPNKTILRRNEKGEEFYIYFSKETVKKASQLFFIRGNQNRATLEHELSLQGLSVVESWIVEDTEKDKSAKYGFDVPVGTWMISMKVQSEEFWNEFVKTGAVKGFSIEGYFTNKKSKLSADEDFLELEGNYIIDQIASESKDKTFSDFSDAMILNAKTSLSEDGDADMAAVITALKITEGIGLSLSSINRINTYLSKTNTLKNKPSEFLLLGGEAFLLWAKKYLDEKV